MAKSENEDSSSEEEFEVENIRSKRIRQGKIEYHIKWKGYPESDNSWEPVDNLDCPELIAKYEKEQEERRRKDEISKKKEIDSKKKKNGSNSKKKDIIDFKRKSVSKKTDIREDVDSEKKTNRAKESGEKSESKKRPDDEASNSLPSKKHKSNSAEESEEPAGFARGLEPAKIMGATEVDGELKFLMAWVGSEDTEMVLAKEANVKCPQLVIDFYEERLTWHNIHDTKN